MKLSGWLRRKVIARFIDRDYPSVLVAVLCATVLMVFFSGFVKARYIASYSGIPATSLALMGFVIAAAAIVVSVQDKGMIRHYKKQNNAMWQLTKNIFFVTARLLGFIGVATFLVGKSALFDCPNIYETLIERFYLGLITAASIFGIFQLNKMIYVLSKLMDAAQDVDMANKIDRRLEEEKDNSRP